MLELSLPQARRLMIGAQLLAGPSPEQPTKDQMRDVIRHLGVVQIDSISVVERSHHLVLWSRLGNHPTEWLHQIHADDRQVFEYLAHANAYVPIDLYGCFRHKMIAYAQKEFNPRLATWLDEHGEVVEHVIEHIQQNGPAGTRAFEAPEGAARPTPWAWYGNKPTNQALDCLWRTGVLMIHQREGFQRSFDLTERVHPTWKDAALPALEEAHLQLASTALQAMGVTTYRWLPDYFRMQWNHRTPERSIAWQVLESLVEAGEAVPASIEGIEEPAYASKTALERADAMSRTTLLSPFDNLIWDRERTRTMFDFPLRLEAYTPKDKRVYGYYSMPILHRDELVGRLDPKADRRHSILRVKNLHLEPAYVGRDDDIFYADLAATLHDFAAFNKTEEIVVEHSDPVDAGKRLEDALQENL